MNKTKRVLLASFVIILVTISNNVFCQMFPPAPVDQRPGRAAAPFDMTGYWVSIITEDWRYRMRTPPKNDYPGLFLNPRARQIADAWDPAKDEAAGEQCKSYGAGAIMRVPTRLHISWADKNTLRIETDAGKQIRNLRFGNARNTDDAGTWQGVSNAEWIIYAQGPPAPGSPPPSGTLKVDTSNMKPGYIRKNGVPYSGNATLTEYFDLVTEPNGDQYLIVVSILEDPEYLLAPVLTSSNFRRQAGKKGWNPTACSAQ